MVHRLLACKQRVRNAISVKHRSSGCQVCQTSYAAPVTVNCHCLSLNACHWILTDSISRPQRTDKVNQVAPNKLPELLLATTVFSFMQWSFGVTCWEIFSTAKTPYPGIHPTSLIAQLENGERLPKPNNAACCDSM